MNDQWDPGNQMSVSVVSGPAHGLVTVNNDNSLNYTADPSFSGTDVLYYALSNQAGDFSTAPVSITVSLGSYGSGGGQQQNQDPYLSYQATVANAGMHFMLTYGQLTMTYTAQIQALRDAALQDGATAYSSYQTTAYSACDAFVAAERIAGEAYSEAVYSADVAFNNAAQAAFTAMGTTSGDALANGTSDTSYTNYVDAIGSAIDDWDLAEANAWAGYEAAVDAARAQYLLTEGGAWDNYLLTLNNLELALPGAEADSLVQFNVGLQAGLQAWRDMEGPAWITYIGAQPNSGFPLGQRATEPLGLQAPDVGQFQGIWEMPRDVQAVAVLANGPAANPLTIARAGGLGAIGAICIIAYSYMGSRMATTAIGQAQQGLIMQEINTPLPNSVNLPWRRSNVQLATAPLTLANEVAGIDLREGDARIQAELLNNRFQNITTQQLVFLDYNVAGGTQTPRSGEVTFRYRFVIRATMTPPPVPGVRRAPITADFPIGSVTGGFTNPNLVNTTLVNPP